MFVFSLRFGQNHSTYELLARNAALIVYEYPFNERIRTLLRLEDLYVKFKFFVVQDNPLQHHVALATIYEMLEVAGRADLKSDLLQELERQKQTLMGFKSNPNVESSRLNEILSDIERTSAALIAIQGKTGQHIRENEWLMSIRGRTIIPGGACEFDLPSYHAWQQQSTEQRRADINGSRRLSRCSQPLILFCACCANQAAPPISWQSPVASSKCYKAVPISY